MCTLSMLSQSDVFEPHEASAWAHARASSMPHASLLQHRLSHADCSVQDSGKARHAAETSLGEVKQALRAANREKAAAQLEVTS